MCRVRRKAGEKFFKGEFHRAAPAPPALTLIGVLTQAALISNRHSWCEYSRAGQMPAFNGAIAHGPARQVDDGDGGLA
jgi:hypothetical protein